jgi:hypothetical protein
MNRRFFQIFFPVFLAGTLCLFTACPTEAGDPGGTKNSTGDEGTVQKSEGEVKTLTFPVPGDSAIWYFSLGAGEWLRDAGDPYSPDWDLAFQDSRIILTNSGDTESRLNSGGLGGVWFTNTTDFEAVTSPAAKTLVDPANPDFDYTPYHTDFKRHVMVMGIRHERWLNVMTYAGYPNEDTPYASSDPTYPTGIYDGSSEKMALAGNGSLVNYLYDKKQYYVNPPLPDGGLRMPPDFQATGQVYIVRHGNGVEYSKFHVKEFFRDLSVNPPTDNYTITWQVFGEEE